MSTKGPTTKKMHVTSWMLRPRGSPFAPLSEAQSRIMFDFQWFVHIFQNLNRSKFTVSFEMRSSLGPGAVFFESRFFESGGEHQSILTPRNVTFLE